MHEEVIHIEGEANVKQAVAAAARALGMNAVADALEAQYGGQHTEQHVEATQPVATSGYLQAGGKSTFRDFGPRLAWFTREMESVLREHDYKGDWRVQHAGYLLMKLMQRIGSLTEAIDYVHEDDATGLLQDSDYSIIIRKAVHVANYALMIADTANYERQKAEARRAMRAAMDAEAKATDPLR